jgi:hypothetical protein
MATNKLMGSGPSPGGGNADGPSPAQSGTLGNAPQAAPQTAPSNMLAQGQPMPGGAPQGGSGPQDQQPLVPPTKEKLFEAAHKQSIVTAHLKALLGKSDLKTKDILNAVGEVIADGVMGPFDAAKYLADLPGADAEPLQLRKWVAQHYANATKALATVTEMIAAHGQMTRMAQAQSMPDQSMPPPQAAPANALSGPPQ